jgi:flagellar basal-body rod modification protein FlgD
MASPPTTKGIDSLGADDFLKLLLTQLQSQDPMNPMDDAQMVQQISQIREIQSNMQLTETLKSVTLGQGISTASSLIGRQIKGLTAGGTEVEGKVDKVTVTDGKPQLQVGQSTVELSNVLEILLGEAQQ